MNKCRHTVASIILIQIPLTWYSPIKHTLPPFSPLLLMRKRGERVVVWLVSLRCEMYQENGRYCTLQTGVLVTLVTFGLLNRPTPLPPSLFGWHPPPPAQKWCHLWTAPYFPETIYKRYTVPSIFLIHFTSLWYKPNNHSLSLSSHQEKWRKGRESVLDWSVSRKWNLYQDKLRYCTSSLQKWNCKAAIFYFTHFFGLNIKSLLRISRSKVEDQRVTQC